jgi:hypothetical protein
MRHPSFLAILCSVVLTAGCGGGTQAAPADGAPQADAASDATGGEPDTGGGGNCPDRTAGPGVPQGDVPAGAVVEGNVTVASADDMTALAGIRVITGILVIEGGAPDLVLPDLEVVGRSIQVTGSVASPPQVDLPALETIGGQFASLSGPLATVSAPRLESTGAGIVLNTTGAVSFPCLAQGSVDLNLGADTLELPRLRVADSVSVSSAELVALELPALEGAGGVQARYSPKLVSISLPALAGPGPAGGPAIGVYSVPALTTISAPLAELSGMSLWNAPLLDSLDIGGLASISAGIRLIAVPMLDIAELGGITQAAELVLGNLPNRLDLDDFASLSNVGVVRIFDNPNLIDVSGIAAITTAELLLIENNDALTTIDLPRLAALTDRFEINGNDALATLSLDALVGIGGTSSIQNNTSLPTCQAEAIRQRLLDSGAFYDVTIAGNGAGTCN